MKRQRDRAPRRLFKGGRSSKASFFSMTEIYLTSFQDFTCCGISFTGGLGARALPPTDIDIA